MGDAQCVDGEPLEAGFVDGKWQSLGRDALRDASAADQDLATGALARGLVARNPERVRNFFGNMSASCRQVTSLSFKLQKHDIYVAKREDPKLRDHCHELLCLASAAQKVASAYRHR